MPVNPETRESLILRLPTASDADAWRQFIDLYEPLILRFAKRRGLQDADAREIAQNVFLSVAKAVDRWQPDRERGKFRAWLFRIARNHLINWVSKRSHAPTLQLADTEAFVALAGATADDPIEMDYRREMFRLAAALAKDSFQQSTWDAFWKTCVKEEPISQVAQELEMSAGSIYIARSRVLSKIKSIIAQWEENDAI